MQKAQACAAICSSLIYAAYLGVTDIVGIKGPIWAQSLLLAFSVLCVVAIFLLSYRAVRKLAGNKYMIDEITYYLSVSYQSVLSKQGPTTDTMTVNKT